MADDNDMTNEPQSMTEEEELLQAGQGAAKVETMLNTPGWTEIIRPALDLRRQYYMASLLSRHEKMEDVMFAQQSLLAIDELLGLIEHTLVEGKHAEEYFKTKQGESQE